MERVSIGYLFSKDKNYVALVKQNFEDKVLLNGIGGHIEDGESSLEAMIREFNEETGVIVNEWKLICTLLRNDLQIDFYSAFSDEVYNVKTVEQEMMDDGEEIVVLPLTYLHYVECHPNLKILIGMCFDENLLAATLIY